MKAKPGFYGTSNISIKNRDAWLVVEVKKTEQIKKSWCFKISWQSSKAELFEIFQSAPKWWTQLAVQPYHNDLEYEPKSTTSEKRHG